MEIQHLCPRQHILLLGYTNIINDNPFCAICNSSVAAPYYVCDACKYFVHKSCAELPHQINHSFHPRHPLTLLTRKSYSCDSCNQSFKNAACFGCVQCNLNFDVECALMTNSITCSEGQQHCIQHSSHPHILELIDRDINADIEIKCFSCNSKSSPSGSGVYYGCNKCKYFLHKHCMDQLPQETLSPFHPHHCLFLRAKLLTCRCCFCDKEEHRTLFFECPQCDFQLCVECGVKAVRIQVKYEDHEHLLYFVEKKYTKLSQCNAYNGLCKRSVIFNSSEFDITSSFMFQCLECDFNIHLLCGPLPFLINYKGHIDPLFHVDSYIADATGEHYCDICETERNPRIRVYVCRQCKYVAHVHCLIFEIINVLKGDLKDVKLKSLEEDLWEVDTMIDEPRSSLDEKEQGRSSFTLKDLIAKLDVDELRQLKEHFYWDKDNKSQREESQRSTQLGHGDENIDEILRFSNFTEREINFFIKYYFHYGFHDRKSKINSRDLALKITDIEGYSIPIILAPVLKHFLSKYGDISRNSTSSRAMKSITFFFLCQVHKKLHSTLIIDITKDLLQEWYDYVEFARYCANFDIDFLKASLEDITRAFFYLQVGALDESIPAIIMEKVADLQKKIAEYEVRLEKCKIFQSSKPKFMEKGVNKMMKLKWRTAGDVEF